MLIIDVESWKMLINCLKKCVSVVTMLITTSTKKIDVSKHDVKTKNNECCVNEKFND